jgi:hypothetical protein
MGGKPHGAFEIQHCGEVLLLRFMGSFNLEGARRLTRGLQLFWHGCGEPTRWAVLADLRGWEGATPDALCEAAVTMRWMVEHGLAVDARVFSTHFMARVLDQQPGMNIAPLPSVNFEEVHIACDWIESFGFDCADCRRQLGIKVPD